MKSLWCLLGFHDWHEHNIYSQSVHVVVGGRGRRVWDRICLKCGHEDRRASRVRHKDEMREAQKADAERALRNKGTNRQ